MLPEVAQTTNGETRARAVRFLRDFAVHTAARTQEVAWGVAVFADELPLVFDMNLVWVDAIPEQVFVEQFCAELERVQGAAGLRHRHAVVADEASGERFETPLSALGWSTKRNLLMAQRRAPDRIDERALAKEIDEHTMRTISETTLRQDPARFSEEEVRQIAATKRAVAAAGARFFGVEVDGIVASACDLYTDGQTAQIEAVITLEEYRNRGLARAVVLGALAEARAAGSDLVFLQAEENDWPKELYAKLGFELIGRTYVFLRAP